LVWLLSLVGTPLLWGISRSILIIAVIISVAVAAFLEMALLFLSVLDLSLLIEGVGTVRGVVLELCVVG